MAENKTHTEQNTDNNPSHPKERILSAALDLFVSQGYFNTNVPDISKKSKCSVGSIYHHFLNKEEIGASIYFDGIKQFREGIASAIGDETNLEKIVRSVVTSFLAFAEDHETLSRYLWLCRHDEFLSGKVSHPTMVGFDNFGRKLTKSIKTAIREGQIPSIKADIFWAIVFGIPVSYVRDWLDGFTLTSPKEAADILANAAWNALHVSK